MKLSDYEKLYSSGSVIYRQGDSPDFLCLVQKGKVELYKSRGDKRSLQKIVTEGSFFGLEEFLLGMPREEEAAAAEAAVVLELPRHLAESYLLSNPKFLLDLCEFLARRSRTLDRAFILSGKSEGARLAAALWRAFSGGGNGGVPISPEATCEILSGATGLSSGRIGDYLAEFERLEILGRSEQGLFLKSSEKLFRYAEYLEDKEHFG